MGATASRRASQDTDDIQVCFIHCDTPTPTATVLTEEDQMEQLQKIAKNIIAAETGMNLPFPGLRETAAYCMLSIAVFACIGNPCDDGNCGKA
jgi:hypothetical protein